MARVKLNKTFFFSSSTFLKTVLQQAQYLNQPVPVFCYHLSLSIAGNCRICSAEVKGVKKPITACYYPVTDNIKFSLVSPRVKKANENVLENLLINHPLDCPTCDQGGECDLQDKSLEFGRPTSRFFSKKRSVSKKNILHFLKTSMVKCIQCTRCVRLNYLLGGDNLGTLFRQKKNQISAINSRSKILMLACLSDICPVNIEKSQVSCLNSKVVTHMKKFKIVKPV